MGKRLIAAFALLGLIGSAFAQEGKFRLAFSETDAGQIFKVIGSQTGANIVYGVKEKILVTISITVSSTDEAIRSTAAAAGLSYKKFATTFVIAKSEDLRKAVHPYTARIFIPLTNADPAELVKLVEATFPAVSAAAIGNVIAIDAIPTDTTAVRDYVWEAEKAAPTKSKEVVRVKFVSPSQLTSMLGLLFPNVKVTTVGAADATSGVLGLTGTRPEVEGALALIADLDVAPKGVHDDLRHELYMVRYASPVVLKEFLAEALPELKVTVGPESYTPMQPAFRTLSAQGIGGSSSSGSSTGAGSTSGAGMQIGSGAQPFQKVKEGDRSKAMLLQGPQSVVENGLKLLAQFDTRPLQVKVDIQVVDVSPEKMTASGFDWSWSPFQFKEAPPGTEVSTFNENTRPSGFGAFSRVPWDFKGILSALVTKKEAKILANPSFQVVDNDDANFFIGNTLRVKLDSSGALGAQSTEIREFPIGIVLLYRPRVNANGDITLRLHPVVSSLTELDSDGIPQSSVREAESTVIVKNGETVVIGGLIREEMRRTVKEVPLLADIPLLGELFRSRSTSNSRSEIMVFVTTRILEDKSK